MSRSLALRFAASAAMLAFLSASCSSGESEPKAAKPAPVKTKEPSTSQEPAGPYKFDGSGADVSRARFGKQWPLTVKSGRVNCVKESSGNVVVIFSADDNKRYALNGVAKAASTMKFYGLRSVDSIWADDRAAGFKKDIGALIDVCAPLM